VIRNLNYLQIQAITENHISQTTFGLIKPHEVCAFGIDKSIKFKRLAGLFYLHIIKKQEVNQSGRLVGTDLKR
jgi:hypothetical protein